MIIVNARASAIAVQIAFDLLDLPGTFDDADTQALVNLTGTTIGGIALGQCVQLVTSSTT